MKGSGSPTVNRVLENNLCSGCGLCASLSGGTMIVEQPGYNRPSIAKPVSAETERLIANACPGSVVAPWETTLPKDIYWGPYLDTQMGHATDERLRTRASSGGVLSALIAFAIERGLVDGAVEVCPDPARPTANSMIVSTSREDVFNSAGSRYAPSSPLEHVADLLAGSRKLLFLGKPCDVSALRLLGTSDPRVDQVFPLKLSFFCAGIPSLQGSDKVLQSMGVDSSEVRDFRYRGEGWPGYATAVRSDGTEAQMSYEDSWGGHLSKEVQFRCKICPDAVGGTADLVCADAWYGDEQGYPLFDELPGRSLIIVRTASGADLLSTAISEGAVALSGDRLEIGAVNSMQPSQARRKRLIRSRTLALRSVGRAVPKMDGLLVGAASRHASAREKIRNFLGTIKRVVSRAE